MRPIERGPEPQKFNHYREAMPYLEHRLGRYCSYCERHFPDGLAVEHVSPKSTNQAQQNEWTNFLIGCVICNSSKGTKPYDAQQMWPDKDDTFSTITYTASGRIKANDAKSETLLALVGLNKSTKQDRSHRWLDRIEAWGIASDAKQAVAARPESREFAIKAATKVGHWSIWMTVFADNPSMRQLLVEAFPGTATERIFLYRAVAGANFDNSARTPKPVL
jgi:uncharacterized protein (TIGR02646 family)